MKTLLAGASNIKTTLRRLHPPHSDMRMSRTAEKVSNATTLLNSLKAHFVLLDALAELGISVDPDEIMPPSDAKADGKQAGGEGGERDEDAMGMGRRRNGPKWDYEAMTKRMATLCTTLEIVSMGADDRQTWDVIKRERDEIKVARRVVREDSEQERSYGEYWPF